MDFYFLSGRRFLHLGLFSIFILLSLLSFGQNIVNSNISRNQIRIGEPIELKISVDFQNSEKFAFPHLPDSIDEHFELVSTPKTDTLKDVKKYIHTIIFTSFDSGAWQFPSLTVLRSTNKGIDTLTSQPYVVSVQTVAVDTTNEFKDIKAPLDAPFTFEEFIDTYWPLLVGIALAVLLFFGIRYYMKLRKANKPIFNFAKPQDPAHVVALRDLLGLAEKKLWQQQRLKEYYTELTDILRVYIENRFEQQAMEQTSDEILDSMKITLSVYPNSIESLSLVLRAADMVKFAKYQTMPEENDRYFKLAIEFVEKTKFQMTSVENQTNPEKSL